MATHVLRREDRYPVGQSVTARLKSNWLQHELPPTGDPKGSAAATATVQADGSVTFTGLADATSYFAHADISGDDRYVSFRTPNATSSQNTVIDAKGDLLVGTADDTISRLAVGSNAQVLTADSAEATGVKWAAAGGGSAPAFGTSLPVAADGLEYYWEVDAVNGVVWHMRYDAALAKWLFLGGPPLTNQVDTSETTTSTTYAALTTPGPLVALPGVGGGLYVVEHGCEITAPSAAVRATMSYDIGGSAAVDGDRVTNLASGTNASMNVMRRSRKTIATQLTLTAKYKIASGTGTFAARWLSVLPVHVNAA